MFTYHSLVGQQFGLLTVLDEFKDPRDGEYRCRCLCSCGKETTVQKRSLSRGNTKSCGCQLRKDVTGQRFGFLTALYDTGRSDPSQRAIWHMRCDCGNEVDVSLGNVRKMPNASCGCKALRPGRRYTSLVGQQFGRLTVLEDYKDSQGRYLCRCLCSCGKETTVLKASLKSGRTKSCGCLKKTEKPPKEPRYKPITGQQFGRLTVLDEFRGDKRVYWCKCLCSCGKEILVRKAFMKNGRTQSCGCMPHNGRDVTGKRYGHLTALYDTGEKDSTWETLRRRAIPSSQKQPPSISKAAFPLPIPSIGGNVPP